MSIEEAKNRFSELVRLPEEGERVVLTRSAPFDRSMPAVAKVEGAQLPTLDRKPVGHPLVRRP